MSNNIIDPNYLFYCEFIVLEIHSVHGNFTLRLDPWDNKIESLMEYIELVRGTQIDLFHMMCLGWDLRPIYKGIQDPNFSYSVYSHDPEYYSYYLEDLRYDEKGELPEEEHQLDNNHDEIHLAYMNEEITWDEYMEMLIL